MSYGRIRRGPMAADAFTQIRNSFFRDTRLTFKDKGVFGLISTHKDGFGVTPESIAHFSSDGVSAVKVALRNLEKYGYLQRIRQRNADGTLGASVYFITDQPEAFAVDPELESPSSAPEVENPPVDKPPMDEPPVEQPPVVEPPVENRSHKKTNSKHTSPKKTLSPPPASVAAPEPPAPSDDERENSSPEHDTDQILAAYEKALGRPVSAVVRTRIRDQAGKLLADGLPAWWIAARARELAERGWTDLAKHCEMSTVPVEVRRPDGLPEACDAHSKFQRMIYDSAGDLVNCPTCHPDEIARQQTGAA